MTFKRTLIAGAVVFTIAFVVLSLSDGGIAFSNTGSTDLFKEARVATDAEMKEFKDLLLRDERIVFDSMVTGDISRYPEIYVNDSGVDLTVEYDRILDEDGQAAGDVLTSLAPEKAAGPPGFLTARIAVILRRQENQAAWAEAQKRAAAEGRQATSADMPNGEVPYPPVYADQWVEVPYNVYDGKVTGDHAEVKLTYGPPETAQLILTYTLTNVDGRWYISGERSEVITELNQSMEEVEIPDNIETSKPVDMEILGEPN